MPPSSSAAQSAHLLERRAESIPGSFPKTIFSFPERHDGAAALGTSIEEHSQVESSIKFDGSLYKRLSDIAPEAMYMLNDIQLFDAIRNVDKIASECREALEIRVQIRKLSEELILQELVWRRQ
jgi:hypothetical protein